MNIFWNVPKYISLFKRQIKTLLLGSNIYLADPGYVTNLRSVFLGILIDFFVNDTKMLPVDFIVIYMDFFLTFKHAEYILHGRYIL